ncbi:hypothetical protein OG2516_16474 [Oceanicola granulosus HTCC2516]|uniref:Uncharacterized protein n=1 Tax=Oceanicola granulosus (strain ATCC BAA-861 / DSM 15982 / KCTC 12143 / HTCC2516) TaxID=314256 RepID=Q2CGM1_OCEGH|nr:Tm-1-like ATP-binding domain-containing protein [Oceanicola granulosus]EAR51914.1 hypothetical protein OG2516_16474 [Oceanicola granulosus HTCC2516]
MSATIYILSTADTKGEETAFLRERIEAQGGTAKVIDFGVMSEPTIPVDVTAGEVARAGGADLAALRAGRKREEASAAMTRGMIALLSGLHDDGKLQGVVGLGGTQGTAAATAVMRALPYGLPKVMISTMASGDTSGYVGNRDITMMFSVSDILGLNPFLRNVLNNAAGAVVGMADAAAKVSYRSERPVIGMTNLGVLTQGTMHAIGKLNEAGYEVIVFHAVGSGGAAMEAMMREGVVTAVFDYALGELTDQMFGGIRASDDSRMTVAAELGLPTVIVPGGADHIGVLVDEPDAVPERYAGRKVSWHNPVILVPRTSADEGRALMAELARRMRHARNCAILLPLKGVSSYSVEGGELRDPDADAALFEAAHAEFDGHLPVIDVDAAAEDPAFVERAIAELTGLIDRAS